MRIVDLGDAVSYSDGMAHMRTCMNEVEHTTHAHSAALLLLEHQATITITRQHGERHLKLPLCDILARGIEVVETDRGGDVTFHGPGQLVGYPILRLKPLLGPSGSHFVDLHGYVRSLEHALLTATHALGLLDAFLIPHKTGIWILGADGKANKLIAIGVGVSMGVTRHGFALNITTELERYTACITPCGLADHGVTSLKREMERRNKALPSQQHIKDLLSKHVIANLTPLIA